MNYNIDKKYDEYLKALKKTKFEGLMNYDVSRILYNDIGFSFNMKFTYIAKHVLFRLFFVYMNINVNKSDDQDILLFTHRFGRRDHDQYWESFKKLINNFNEIEIFYTKDKLKFNYHIFEDIKNFAINLYKLKEIDIWQSRIWLALQLINAKKITEELDRINVQCKVVFMFYDGGFEGSIISQYFKRIKSKTVTLQHGQCLFRENGIDHLNQSVIMNFISDYCICKGEFSKQQFVRAGIDEKRVIPLGDLNFKSDTKVKDLHSTDSKKAFCVFLDTPSYDFYERSTKNLIEFSNEFSELYNYNYYIKPHPADNKKSYLKYTNIKYNIKVFDNNSDIADIIDEIDFSIFHASAIYSDLLRLHIKPFKYISEIPFNIVTDEFDAFYDVFELKAKIETWYMNGPEEKKSYFDTQNKIYSNPIEVKERYLDFIKEIIDDY